MFTDHECLKSTAGISNIDGSSFVWFDSVRSALHSVVLRNQIRLPYTRDCLREFQLLVTNPPGSDTARFMPDTGHIMMIF